MTYKGLSEQKINYKRSDKFRNLIVCDCEMKIYEFRAGIPKDDMIMWLYYPMAFLVPLLIILLCLEIIFPHKNITARATLNSSIEVGILFPSFIISSLLITHLRKKLGHDFKVQIDYKEITVWMDNKKIIVDFIKNIIIKKHTQGVKIKICGIKNNIVFIGREKRSNLFGFSQESDLLTLSSLADQVQKCLLK